MFETLEAIRKYPLEAKRRLVVIVTVVVVAPIAVTWLIWFIATLEISPIVMEAEQPAPRESDILPPYAD